MTMVNNSTSVNQYSLQYGVGHTGQAHPQRPTSVDIAENLFTKLDRKEQGFIEEGDLKSAFSNIDDESDLQASIHEIFNQLDLDGNGKITQQEMTERLTQVVDQLRNQLQSTRMHALPITDMAPATENTSPDLNAMQKMLQLVQIYDPTHHSTAKHTYLATA